MSKKKQQANKRREQPRWRPISFLPSLAEHIDGMLAADVEQYETLLEAKPKPALRNNIGNGNSSL